MSDPTSESFGNIPNDAAAFGNVPHASEPFRTLRNSSVRTESHTLTVREVARLFEAAGVARTERSIVNWCQPNRMGVSRLDCYFDPNERKYFITPESVERAIAEEQARTTREEVSASQPRGLPHRSAEKSDAAAAGEPSAAMQRELRDLQITNRAKDLFIEQLQSERKDFVERLVEFSRKVGELETTVKHIAPPSRTTEGEEDTLPASL